MFTLRDFIASREIEIREQIKLLRAELAELKRARVAVDQPDGHSDGGSENDVRDANRVTIKDMVRSVFARPEASAGMVVGEVLDAIERLFGTKIERTSLSPQLSRLRESGDVVLQEGRWFPSEPRLSQSLVSGSRSDTHRGGSIADAATDISLEAACLSLKYGDSQIAAAEARKLKQDFITASVVTKARLAAESVASAQTVAQYGKPSVVAATTDVSALHSMKTLEEAERKMRLLIYGSGAQGVTKIWGSGPKTE
ncbi:hypothetical protein [Sphingomonas prati]|uniref:Uncharacterized protein n=1 Tax=Sphingomonas prati TaxID=1843237 RepID=A0A7W9F1X9_9SPHN|nr:hypothetical protein [Sphingomonas prati]MBB5729932.1 hypothetical protein [Sphingomonas prati]